MTADEPIKPRDGETAYIHSEEGLTCRRIGPCKILGLLGEGGFGVVYLAEQTSPVQRRVALKVIKPGMDTAAVLARFEAEEQALARMDHANVARVYNAGTTAEGRPYFIMEHVAGLPITTHCDLQQLTIRERLELFVQVCDAVQHAHQKGIIHRDLKPTNILVATTDDRAVPKVIDFGVAKAISQPLTEKTLCTIQGHLIGTPDYMSPEQADMSGQDVDTRTDIYSLGVLLYELLTGVKPLEAGRKRSSDPTDIYELIREVEPRKPSTRLSRMTESGANVASKVSRDRGASLQALSRLVRGDLDWITMQALEKDRARRYASASDFAADVRRHLAHEPVTAGPPATGYRVRKFVRRHRALVMGTAAVVAVLIVAVVLTTSALLDSVEARKAEKVQREKAERQADIAQGVIDFINDDVFAMAAPGELGPEATIREALDAASESVGTEFPGEPLVEAAIRATLADTYWHLGEYEAALPHAQKAVELRKAALGEEASDTLDSINALALICKYLARYEKAEESYRYVLETRRRILGPDNAITLGAMNGLAVLLRERGELDEAEVLHRKTLAGRRRVLGDDHSDTLNSMTNLGVLLWDKGNLEDAEPLVREALAGRRRTLGDENPLTLQSAYSLAVILRDRGKLAEGEEFYVWTLERARRVFGDHPRAATILTNLARLFLQQDRWGEAEPLAREALQMRLALHGEGQWRTADAMSCLGECLTKAGRFEEAEEHLLAAHRSLADTLGTEHRVTTRTAHWLVSLYVAWDEPEQEATWRARVGPAANSEPNAD